MYGSYYNQRNPNAFVLKYGMLTKITYPTGGYTEFEFEPHDYRKQLNIERWTEPLIQEDLNKIAGGLRVKRIKNSPSVTNSAETIKEYFYVSDYLQNKTNASISSGVLGGQIQYLFTDYTVYAFADNNVRREISMFSSISVLPACQNTNGSHIGYTEVIEKYQDNSFTRYQFTNFDNGYLDESSDAIIQQSRTPYERYASKAHERGKLLLLENYNASMKKVKSKMIEYEKDIASNNYVRAMEARYKNVCPNTVVSYDEGVSYKIYTYLFRPKKETENLYDPISTNLWQSTTTNYIYTDKKLMRSVSFANSDGSIHKTEYKYPFDISGNSILNQMINNNMLSPVVEQAEYRNGLLLKKTVTDYKNWGNNLIEPEIIKMQFTQSGQLENRIAYHNRDLRGNPRYITKDDVNKVVYLWGYNYQYPIAEIKNTTYSEVIRYISESTLNAIAGKAELTTADSITINNLRNQLSSAQVTTSTYKPLVGLTSVIDPRGFATYYEYDNVGRLSGTYIMEDGKKQYIKRYQYNYAK
jgi:YD repeat-containing protein